MSETEYILGVDPGKTGALCFLPLDGSPIVWIVTPEIKGTLEIDIMAIYRFIHPYMQHTRACVIEDVHSVFGSSAKSNFQFGRALGIVETLPSVFGIPMHKVAPKTWQKVAWQGVPLVQKKKVVKGAKGKGGKPDKPDRTVMKTDTKATSLNAAKRIFPQESFLATTRSSVPHDGGVDAALIAYYGKRENL